MSRTLLDNDAIQNTSIKFEKLNEDITSILNKVKDLTFSTAINSSSTDTEFPSSKAVYTSVNNLNTTLSTTINKLSEDITQLNSNLAELESAVNTNSNNIQLNSESIAAINSQIQQINTELSSLDTSLSNLSSSLNSEIDTCKQDITTLNERLTSYINTHTTEYNNLVTRINSLGENVAVLQTKVTNITNSITSINENIDNLTSSLSGYLPLSGGTLTGSVTMQGMNTNLIRNITYTNAGSWARGLITLQVDGVHKFGISALGDYTAGASDNGINYAYIGCNSYDGLNLRISATSLSWGDSPILHSGNFNSYSPKLDGTGATGTWGINISGNAATATNADKLGGYNANSFSKTKLINLPIGQVLRIEMSDWSRGFLISMQGRNGGRNALYFVTGYGSGTTIRNNIRVIKGGPYNIYFNGTSEEGCVYIVGTSSQDKDTIYINPFDYNDITYTIVSSVPSDAVLVSSSNSNILATLDSIEPYIITPTYTQSSEENPYNYNVTNINFTEIYNAVSSKKEVRIMGLLGDTLVPSTISYSEDTITISSSGSYTIPYYYVYSFYKEGTATTSTLSIQNIITNNLILSKPQLTSQYSDLSIANPLLVDAYNYYLITITNLNFNTPNNNQVEGTCAIDKTYAEIKDAIDKHLQLYIKYVTGNVAKVVSQICASDNLELGFNLNYTYFTISGTSAQVSSNTLAIRSYIIPTNYVTTDTEQNITKLKNFNGLRLGYNSDSLTPPTEYPYIGLSQKQLVIMAPSTNYPSIFLRAGSNLTLQATYDIKLSGKNVNINATSGAIQLNGNEIYLHGTIYLEDSHTAGTLLNRIQTLEAKVAALETAISTITVNQ